MKKLIIFVIALSIIAAAFIGCDGKKKDNCFEGNWSFSKITKLELIPDLDESSLEFLMEKYQAEDEAGVIESALADFVANKIFDPCYLNFSKKHAYTYDPEMEREATWVLYKTGENEGFISFYTELDASNGNPDPTLCPSLVYNAETNTLLMTLKYGSFMATIELTR